uniref:Adenylate kinase active site lid domain-containing protein n=2 Tax=Phaeomonas parva TaxID=124430 RepID=A0A7S1XXP2_9STRA
MQPAAPANANSIALPNSAVVPAWGRRNSPLVQQAAQKGWEARARARATKLRARSWGVSQRAGTTMSADAPQVPRIIIAGAPASGKGTQCAMIKDSLNCVHLSTGDMLRAAVEAGTEVGKLAKGYMESGQLVPDDVIIGIVKERLAEPDCQAQGWLLDGFPRTKAQADALAEAGIVADTFLLLNVPDDELIERVVGRRLDPETGDIYHMKYSPPPTEEIAARVTQRSDDTEEKARVRLESYHKNIEAIRDSYKPILKEIDGCRSKAEVFDDVMECVGAKV